MSRRRSQLLSAGNSSMENKNPSLPEHLISEIMLRLPAKPLVRFKCVSKSWLSHISDQKFAKSHFDLTAVKNEKLIIHLSVNGYGAGFNKVRIVTIDLEGETLQESSVELVCPISTSLFPCSKTRNVCRGFILFEYCIPERLLVWNPTTGAIKKIPYSVIMGKTRSELEFNVTSHRSGLVYDAIRDDYLVIQAWIDNLYGGGDDDDIPCLVHCFEFFSMRNNSWTQLDAIRVPFAKEKPHFSFLDGVIHWLAVSDDGKLVKGITAFNLAERKVFDMPLPHDGFLCEGLRFDVIEGCLCLWSCPREQPGTIERWVMKEYKVKSSWIKSNYVLPYAISHPRFIPMYFTKSGGFVGFDYPNMIVKLNDKGELQCCYNDDYPWSGHMHHKYSESLLSLPCECSQAGEEHY